MHIYSSINGHLGYFYLLAVMNSLAMNTVYRYLCGHMFSFLHGVYLRVELRVI